MAGRIGIRGRLAGAIAAILVAALGLTFFAVHRGTESELDRRLDDDLSAQADELSARLVVARPGTPQGVLEAARQFVGAQTFGRSSQVIAVTVPGAGTATNQPELLGLPSPGEGEGEEGRPGDEGGEERDEADAIRRTRPGFSQIDVEDVGQVRILTRQEETSAGGAPATIRVGEPTDSVERALRGLSRTFLLVGGATLALALAAGLLVAVRIAAPLRSMSRTGEEIDAGDLSRRLEVPRARDEVRSLAESFNGMLDRLQAAFAGQKRFVADASHELRTPLTVIRGQLEVLARSSRIEREDVVRVTEVVTTEVDRMERMVEDLLALARGEGGSAGRRRSVPVGRIAREAFASLAVTAERTFEVARVDPGDAVADPEQIGQLVRILTRNAIEHTTDGGRIRLSVIAGAGGLRLAVEDDGPGIPEAERERVFDRFHRASPSPERTGRGAGLGLAIALAIAEAHDGSIEAGDSELGGARVSVTLPVAPGRAGMES